MADCADFHGRDCYPIPSLNRAGSLKVFLSAFALAFLLVRVASAQVIEGYIQLPDSFGVFRAPYQVAWDYTPGEERLFVGGESSDVLVIDAVNFRKLARIPTGRVGPLAFCPAHNKLYATPWGGTSLYVVDCSSYQISKQIHLGEYPAGLFYNPVVDRIYCSTSHMKVVDCTSDSVVGSVSGVGTGAVALDTSQNKLYVCGLALNVVDCYSDSLTASIPRVRRATAICYNPTSDRVYATANTGGTWPDETLYVVDTGTDSVVAQLPMPDRPSPFDPTFTMCSDPIGNRVFTGGRTVVAGVDCATDTLLWCKGLGAYSLACAPDLDRAYVAKELYVYSMEGSTGDYANTLSVDGCAAPLACLDRPSRLYCLASWGQLAAFECGIDTAVGTVPLNAFVDASPERACLDTVDNKLYFAFNQSCGYIGVADCSARLVKSHQMCGYPQNLVHDPLDNKLYVSSSNGSGRSGVSVFDCRSDTLLKFIPTGCVTGGLRWHSVLNKVYAGTCDSLFQQDYVTIIDCATDSVTRILTRSYKEDEFRYSLLSTASNQFWGFSPRGYTVVDCLRDSVVIDTVADDLGCGGVCYSDADRKVYIVRASNMWELVVLSMESLKPTRRIQLTRTGSAVDAMIHVAAARKIYVAVMHGPRNTDSVYVVSTDTDSVVSRFDAGRIIWAMCDDATGRYIYCSARTRDTSSAVLETLLVVDTRCDSVVSGARVPGVTGGPGEWLLPNRRTGRIYAEQDLNGKLLVIRDSVVIGIEDWRSEPAPPVAFQSMVSRTAPFRSRTGAALFDASGRRAAVLRPGPNDIGYLAPGVYFVREEPQATGLQPRAIRKVVIAR